MAKRRSFIASFVSDCGTLVVPLLGIMIAVLVLVALGKGELASTVGSSGTALVLLANLVFILLIDPRRRWPGAKLGGRILRFLTFRR